MAVWTTWLSRLAESAPLSGLVYAGADHPELLDAPGPDRAARIILVAANPALQDDYAEFADQRATVLIRAGAVGDSDGPARLHVLSLPGLSSIAEPRGVMDLFPGLRVVNTPEVPVLDLATLMADLPRKAGSLRVLRTELSGSEPAILRQLAQLSEGEAPDHIFLRFPAPGLYAASPNLTEALDRVDFTLEARSDVDPDFPELWLRRDPMKARNRQLRKQLEEQNKARAAAEAQAENWAARMEELENKLRAETAARKAAEARAQDDLCARSEAESAQNTALRLQAMARSDVQELRKRYEDLMIERDAQDALLRQVMARLQALLNCAPAGKKAARKKPGLKPGVSSDD